MMVPFSKVPALGAVGQDPHVPGRVAPPAGLRAVGQPPGQHPPGHREGRLARPRPDLAADEHLPPPAPVPAVPAVPPGVAQPAPDPAERRPLPVDRAVHHAGPGPGAVAHDALLEPLVPRAVRSGDPLGGRVAQGPARAAGPEPGGAGRAVDRPRAGAAGPVDRPAAVVHVPADPVAHRPLGAEGGAEVGPVGAQLVVPAQDRPAPLQAGGALLGGRVVEQGDVRAAVPPVRRDAAHHPAGDPTAAPDVGVALAVAERVAAVPALVAGGLRALAAASSSSRSGRRCGRRRSRWSTRRTWRCSR